MPVEPFSSRASRAPCIIEALRRAPPIPLVSRGPVTAHTFPDPGHRSGGQAGRTFLTLWVALGAGFSVYLPPLVSQET